MKLKGFFVWIRDPDEEDVFCGNCGARNPPGTAYCMGCGKSLT